MKNLKNIIVSILLIIVTVYSALSLVTNTFCKYQRLNFFMLFLVFCVGFILLKQVLIYSRTNLNSEDKLLKSLMENSDTVYIMINSKNKKVVYLSKTVENILGIKIEEKNNESIVSQILNIPVIKSELNNWDKFSEYVSQMVEYDNPKYNHKMWIKIKILPYKQKSEEYYIIQVIDATKEHSRQHLLISQATDIKARENTLNQITAKSYDFEININLTLNSYDLKYYKKDNLYFGEEKKGKYTE